MSIERGIKMWFSTIWRRHSGGELGSASMEKVEASAVKTLVRGEVKGTLGCNGMPP